MRRPASGHPFRRMTRNHKLLLSLAAAAAVGAGGAALAVASGDDDAAETPITGAALERASAAALAETGAGRVTGTEAGDEEGAYEVEVTRPDGSQVDVHLDSSFRVIGREDEAAGEADD